MDTLSFADNEMSDRQALTLYISEYILALLISKLLCPRDSFYALGGIDSFTGSGASNSGSFYL
jgi:hypothetical protein